MKMTRLIQQRQQMTVNKLLFLNLKRGYIFVQCTFCQKAFQAASSLKIHERIHAGEVPFECRICKKRFKRKSVLKEHEVIHTEEMPFECNTCMKVFKTKSNLFQHTKRSHTEVHKTFKCEICHKAYQTKGALKKHKNIHFDNNPFQCKTCSKNTQTS